MPNRAGAARVSRTSDGRTGRRRLLCAAGIAALAAAGGGGTAHAQALDDFRPVTDAVLQNPDAGDWIHWRRTLDAQGHSPLDEITPANAGELRLVWSWALAEGSQQTTPLAYGGVLYIANPGERVQAIDGATGELLWEYQRARQPREDGSRPANRQHRNLAIYQDKIYLNTSDAHIVALDARTGEEVWDSDIGGGVGYRYTSGSIIADGKVFSGLTGCDRYRDDTCYIIGLDAATGRELWRTSTVARPGERGGDTWGDLPVMFRAGSDAWIPGSYDPGHGTVYFGTAQAKPWARSVRGTDGDALYTNSTLALDPASGEMKWYFQHLPGESHDMDETFERILVDYDDRQSVFTMGKIAVLWELDRGSGEFRAAHDLGYQTLFDIHAETGRATYREGMVQEIGEEIHWCPSTAGFKSWRAMSYNPDTEAFYIPLNLNCETGIFGPVEKREGGGGAGPVRRTNHFHPHSPEHIGEFLAMSMRTGKVLWRHRTRTPMNTAALTTSGGIAVAGDWDRYLYVYDARTGDVLWQTRLPTSVQGYPISYEAGGKQYLAVPAGIGGASWNNLVPSDLTPEKRHPPTGNSVFVFALP